jgi:hypothetical protein
MAQISFDEDFAGPSDYAALYRQLRLQVVPSLPPSNSGSWKRPAIKWREHEDILTTQDVFDQWYGHQGEYRTRQNMGLITGKASGNVWVLDLDTHKNPQANEWLKGLLDLWNDGAPLISPTQRTGGGGVQILFRSPEGWTPPTIKTSIGVDIRGQGGFAVLPPSMHESGVNYAWIKGYEPWLVDIQTAPSWLTEAIDDLASHFTSVGPSERTGSPDTAINPFGQIVDGREDYMRNLIWAKVVDHRREIHDAPFFREAEAQQWMEDAFVQYEQSVKSRLVEAGTSNAELLEREGRGISEFTKKWLIAMSKWRTDVKIAAELPKKARGDVKTPEPAMQLVQGDDGVWRPQFEAFPLLSVKMIRSLPDPKYLIEGLIIENGLGFFYGPPGCGKSFITIGMALSIAAGLDEWWGYKINKSGPMIYISSEGVSDLKFRIAAWEQATGISAADIPFYLIHVPINFMDDGEIERLILTIQYSDMLKGEVPVGIVVDTVSRSLPGADENLQKDMTLFIKACDKIRLAFDCTVMGVHHTSRAGNLRGSTVFDGAADFLFRISREEGVMIGEFNAKKIKSATDGWTKPFKLREVLCGDIAGNTSLYAEPALPEEVVVEDEWPSKPVCQDILNAMSKAWDAGKPWSTQPNTRRDGRYAPMLMTRYEVEEKMAAQMIDAWLRNGVIEIDLCDARSKTKGIKVLSHLQDAPSRYGSYYAN